MKIGLIGYGKMGQAVEKTALALGHEIVWTLTSANKAEIMPATLKSADVIIEFSRPEAAFDNVIGCLNAGVPVVCGTTGWYERLDEVHNYAIEKNTAAFVASNFSIGVNLFLEVSNALAALMSRYADYQPSIHEIHHLKKLDSPSGTAITLAQGILQANPNLKNWATEATDDKSVLSVTSERIGEVPGTHVITWNSTVDAIELHHNAHNREGFALGAVRAAEFLKSVNSAGLFGMRQLLGL